ncbi:hypothetical protein KGF54_003220 [Candida jiufengensis]|uniref:uncharacterized protein n=1 Tax=Candida jiufengensis TaxID=497108 RepID=UPI0022248E34|nr:uncharacterized protein KGF54_003220 [Candida jiufengensis]KAI5952354.1 hypothetical protein KGF54_003220 [Candida jiufengensis]
MSVVEGSSTKLETTTPQNQLQNQVQSEPKLELKSESPTQTTTKISKSKISDNNDVNFPIKLINWSLDGFTYDNQKLTTPILLQEKNGPCPLISLVNTLLLQYNFKNLQFDQGILSQTENQYKGLKNLESLLIKKYHSDKKISLNEILSSIGDLLLMYSEEDTSLNPEIVDQLLTQLPKLHTGLDVNPNLITGDFELNLATTLFHIFGLVFKHGWVIGGAPKQVSDETPKEEEDTSIKKLENIMNELQTFDKIQDYLFLEHPNSSVVTNQELIKSWLDTNCTQLTQQGLTNLNTILESSQFIIFFRNNHFNTLFKKSSMEFYLLVTDSSFTTPKNKSNQIIWQSLNSINGENDLFFTGDFMPVLDINQDLNYGTNQDENFDSDLLLVKQLQEEEDAAIAKRMQDKYEKQHKRHTTNNNKKNEQKDKSQKSTSSSSSTTSDLKPVKKEQPTEKPKKKKLFGIFSR